MMMLLLFLLFLRPFPTSQSEEIRHRGHDPRGLRPPPQPVVSGAGHVDQLVTLRHAVLPPPPQQQQQRQPNQQRVLRRPLADEVAEAVVLERGSDVRPTRDRVAGESIQNIPLSPRRTRQTRRRLQGEKAICFVRSSCSLELFSHHRISN